MWPGCLSVCVGPWTVGVVLLPNRQTQQHLRLTPGVWQCRTWTVPPSRLLTLACMAALPC